MRIAVLLLYCVSCVSAQKLPKFSAYPEVPYHGAGTPPNVAGRYEMSPVACDKVEYREYLRLSLKNKISEANAISIK